MPSDTRRIGRPKGMSAAWTVLLFCAGWLVCISLLHWKLNIESPGRPTVRMGYMPVITNLASPLLDYATKEKGPVRFDALKFSSFAEMAESLRNDHIQVAFIIAPLSVVLHQQGAGVRIVYIGNRHESTLVYRSDLNVKTFGDLAGKTLAVPIRFSGHNLCARRLAEQFSVTGPDLKLVEMNPPDMAAALATGALDAYFVGEPFAAQTIKPGTSKVLYYVENVWPSFICNLCLVTQKFIDRQPELVQNMVQGAARSGYWARKNPKEAAKIASNYWNQPVELVEYALDTPTGRIVFDQYTPREAEIQYMADLMVHFRLVSSNDIKGLVNDTFAKQTNVENVTDFNSILNPPR
ncbi:MAG: ABC transporter substrate-binding protein [Thermodesulfobacteriota bacterium]